MSPAQSAERAAPSHPVLSLGHISHRYGQLLAVDDVSLNISAGEIVCLVGPSGCGKSTLLRVAAGLEDLQQGEVWIDSQRVADLRHSTPPEKRGVGLVFQDYALFPHLTVVANVRFGLTGVSGAAQQSRAMDTLARVGMADQAHTYPHTLSGGQQQRVALARALAPQPRVLLLDEPFSGLDVGLRNQVRDETLHLLKQNGAATMIVTHDPEEAMFLADRMALMRDGAVVQIGTPVDLYCQPTCAFAAEFFGDVNRMESYVRDGVVETPVGGISVDGLAEGRPVEILIRPEGLRLADTGPNYQAMDTVRPNGQLDGQNGPTVAMVEAARLLGRTSLIHLAVPTRDGQTMHMHARMPGQFLPAERSYVTVTLDRDQAFVFPLK